jgi:EAL domain-containing protein (putative c-di-GMP-specific phosphodiesterase class I)
MMGELDVVGDVLAELRQLGVEVSVDDFGTGYSSLAILQRVAVNEVKVDRTFVRTMLESSSDLAIVRATVELAHSLGLRVVAEGVESEDLRDLLSSIGCDRAQGYHLGLPAPAADITVDVDATPRAAEPPRVSRRGSLTVIRPRTAEQVDQEVAASASH